MHHRHLTALLATVLTVLTPQAGAQSSDTLKIGLIGPFSGGTADFGQSMRNGIELAVSEINAIGGYVGRKLELVVRDDKSNPDEARRMSQELVQQGVVAAIGFCNSGNVVKSIDVYQQARVPLIVPCATGSAITGTIPAADSYIFRTSPSDGIQVPFVVNEMVRRGITRIALMADNTGYGEGGLKDFTRALDVHRLKPAYVGRFDIGVKDLTEPMKAARDSGAQAVFSIAVGPESAAIGRAREAIGWKVPQIGPWSLTTPTFLDGAKSAAEGALMSVSFVPEPSNERRSTFLANYRRQFQTSRIPVPMAAAQAYDSAYLLTYAILSIKGKALDGPTIKHALENNDRPYYGVVATYKNAFSSSDHDALTENMLYLGTVRNGAVTFANPDDARRNLIVQRKVSAAPAAPAAR